MDQTQISPSRRDLGKDLKILLLRSGGFCAFPTCPTHLVAPETSEDSPVILGEIAHIIARSSKGPRGSSALSKEELDKYENLILLCRDHHKVIDSQPNTFTSRVLKEMKMSHERKMVKENSGQVSDIQLKKEKVHTSLL